MPRPARLSWVCKKPSPSRGRETLPRGARRSLSRPFGLLALFLLLAWCGQVTSGAWAEESPAAGPEQFTRDVLLRRFDVNLNGKLDVDETIALRDAFGGMGRQDYMTT